MPQSRLKPSKSLGNSSSNGGVRDVEREREGRGERGERGGTGCGRAGSTGNAEALT